MNIKKEYPPAPFTPGDTFATFILPQASRR